MLFFFVKPSYRRRALHLLFNCKKFVLHFGSVFFFLVQLGILHLLINSWCREKERPWPISCRRAFHSQYALVNERTNAVRCALHCHVASSVLQKCSVRPNNKKSARRFVFHHPLMKNWCGTRVAKMKSNYYVCAHIVCVFRRVAWMNMKKSYVTFMACWQRCAVLCCVKNELFMHTLWRAVCVYVCVCALHLNYILLKCSENDAILMFDEDFAPLWPAPRSYILHIPLCVASHFRNVQLFVDYIIRWTIYSPHSRCLDIAFRYSFLFLILYCCAHSRAEAIHHSLLLLLATR